jgi:hypothetical protein
MCHTMLTRHQCRKGSYCKGKVCHAETCVGKLPVGTCDAARNFILSSWPSTSTEAPSPDQIQPRGQWTSPSEFAGKAVFECYRNELQPSDVRPRVNVEFLGHDTGVVYSLLFDTGAVSSYIVQQAGNS